MSFRAVDRPITDDATRCRRMCRRKVEVFSNHSENKKIKQFCSSDEKHATYEGLSLSQTVISLKRVTHDQALR